MKKYNPNKVMAQKKSLHRYTPLVLAIFSVLSTAYVAPALAAPIGDEFRVNTQISRSQNNSSNAMNANGDFVVSWTSNDAINSSGIYAQRYNANGTPTGDEFQVNATTTHNEKNPSVAIAANGNFVISWDTGLSANISAQLYSADGTPVGGIFNPNTDATHYKGSPSVAMNANGDFVVIWKSHNQDGYGGGIYAQRFSADGARLGVEIKVNTRVVNDQREPSVAMNANGNFVVVWEGEIPVGIQAFDIFAQRFNANGTPAGTEFKVNTTTDNHQGYSSVAMNASGDFVVSWESGNQDGSDLDVFAQRYSANGSPKGTEFLVNTTTTKYQRRSSVAMDTNGGFVVSWESNENEMSQFFSNYDIYAQRYNTDGTKVGEDFLVATGELKNQTRPSIAMDADGDFVVSWTLSALGGNIYARRYTNSTETIDLNIVVNDDTDPVTVGDNFTYSLITTNNGTGTATNVTLSEPIPSGVTYVSDDAATAGWICGQVATTLECNLPSLSAGATSTIEVTVTAGSAGTSTNTVTVSSAQTDTNTTDNTDTETTVINDASVGSSGGDTSSGGGGGLFSWILAMLLLPLGLRQRYINKNRLNQTKLPTSSTQSVN